jgi:hypothetical protein
VAGQCHYVQIREPLSTPDIQLYAIDYSIPRLGLVLEFKLSNTSPIAVSAAFEQRHNLVI